MRAGRPASIMAQARVVLATADTAFEDSVRAAFGSGTDIDLDVITGTLREGDLLDARDAGVIIVDLNAGDEADLQALERLMDRVGSWPPVIAVTRSFESGLARRLMQLRVADFLVKPVPPVELLRACARVAKSPAGSETTEAQI